MRIAIKLGIAFLCMGLAGLTLGMQCMKGWQDHYYHEHPPIIDVRIVDPLLAAKVDLSGGWFPTCVSANYIKKTLTPNYGNPRCLPPDGETFLEITGSVKATDWYDDGRAK
jgi:hypothetical protein